MHALSFSLSIFLSLVLFAAHGHLLENVDARSAIMIRVATIGYARPPDFEVRAPGEPEMAERIDYALKNSARFRRAFAEEAAAAAASRTPTESRRRSRSRSRSRYAYSKKRSRTSEDDGDGDGDGDDLRSARSKL